MALKRREKVLAGVTGVLGVALLINLMLLGGGTGRLRAQRNALAEDIDDKAKGAWRKPGAIRQLARWKKAGLPPTDRDLDSYRRYIRDMSQRLKDWEQQALPANTEVAQSLYREWLRDVVERADFRGVKFDPGELRKQRNIYTIIPLTIRCHGTLKQLTQFLHDFYAAGHLHRITLLSVTPDEDGLDLVITTEALSLPGSENTESLNPEPGTRLARAEFSDYRDTIVNRDLFAAYKPPPPPPRPKPPERKRPPPRPKPKPPEFDHTKHTFVTAIIEVNGRPQVWLLVRTTGTKHELHEGDTFEIGSRTGTVGHIGAKDVEIEIEGERRLVTFGEAIADGTELPD